MTVESQPLSRLEVERGLRISIWEGISATVFGVLTGGAFQIGFVRALGAGDFILGLIAALAAAAKLVILPLAITIDRLPALKKFVAYTAAYGRWLWVPIAAIPFVVPGIFRMPVFLVLLTVSSILLALSTLGWTSWMGSIVPPKRRGAYFGRRNMLAGIISVLAPLPAGAFLDLAVKHDRFDPRLGFAALFGIAAVAGVVCLFLVLRQPEAAPSASADGKDSGQERSSGMRELLEPFTADRNFRLFLISAGASVFGQSAAGQFFTAWQLDAGGLHLPYLTIQLLSAVAAGAGMAAMPALGLLADRFGSRPVLVLCSASVVIAPIIWLFTQPGTHSLALNVTLITILNIFSGISWAGVGLAQFNMLLVFAPPRGIGKYAAVFGAVTGLTGAVAPLAAGLFMSLLAPLAINVGLGVGVLNNYKALFLLTALMRIGFAFMLRNVREEGSHGSRKVLGKIVAGVRRPVRSLRALRRTDSTDADDSAGGASGGNGATP